MDELAQMQRRTRLARDSRAGVMHCTATITMSTSTCGTRMDTSATLVLQSLQQQPCMRSQKCRAGTRNPTNTIQYVHPKFQPKRPTGRGTARQTSALKCREQHCWQPASERWPSGCDLCRAVCSAPPARWQSLRPRRAHSRQRVAVRTGNAEQHCQPASECSGSSLSLRSRPGLGVCRTTRLEPTVRH